MPISIDAAAAYERCVHSFVALLGSGLLVAFSLPVSAAVGDCGQPVTTGVRPVATDARGVLTAAVGATNCELCVCDVDGDGSIFSKDALLVLQSSVGQQVVLACTPCLTCGNGRLDTGEQCDDGNTINRDDCTDACTVAVCGDGIPHRKGSGGEQCDDGNSEDGDDCTNACTVAVCGDGIVFELGGGVEECDDGNLTAGDGCDPQCRTELPPVFWTLSVTKAGTGTGIVRSDPVGIDCGVDCSESYEEGTLVLLAAFPSVDSSFTGWSGACVGVGECQVPMNQVRNVRATFRKEPCVDISGSWNATEQGTICCTALGQRECLPVDGTDFVFISQTGCSIGWEVDVPGLGIFPRDGTVVDRQITASGQFVVPAAGTICTQNRVDITGTISGVAADRIDMIATGSARCTGQGVTVTCTGTTTSVFTRPGGFLQTPDTGRPSRRDSSCMALPLIGTVTGWCH